MLDKRKGYLYLRSLRNLKREDPFTMIIQINGIDHNTHRKNPSITLSAMKHCPLCGRLLRRNGWYNRFVRAMQCLYMTVIYRKICKICKLNLTLLPHFILSHHRHMKSTIVTWLRACVVAHISCLESDVPDFFYRMTPINSLFYWTFYDFQ